MVKKGLSRTDPLIPAQAAIQSGSPLSRGRAEPEIGGRRLLVVAIDALAPLVAFLGFDRERRDRTGFEPLERDRLAGLLAKAVSALFDALERGVDLGDQLALAVAGPQLDGPVGFRRGPVGEVGVILALVLEMLERLLGLLEDVLPPVEQFQPEILPLALAHER